MWENLYFHGLLFGVPKQPVASHVADELLEQFVLSKWAKASVHALSGGMAQRLMVARAILHRPARPLHGRTDGRAQPPEPPRRCGNLGDLNHQGQTIMLTTHYMEEANQLCDRVAIMDHGKILALDTPARLKQGIDADTIVTVRAGRNRTLAELLEGKVEGAVRARLVDGGVELYVRNPGQGLLPRVVNVAGEAGNRERPLDIRADTRDRVHSPHGQRAARLMTTTATSADGARHLRPPPGR